MPDFFDDRVFAHPAVLEGFQSFTLEMTRRSARNVDLAIPRSAAAKFMRSAISLGFSLGTACEIFAQLLDERREPRVRIRRRSLQALLTADVFVSMLRKDLPDFSTLYTNHVAAAMHRYWRAAFPTDCDSSLIEVEWQKLYSTEILESMRITDKMLGKLRRFVDGRNDVTLLIASSMGQCATSHPPSKGMYTIRDTEKFLAAFGIDRGQFRRRHAMVPCIGFIVDASVADKLKEQLNHFRVDGSTMLESEREISPMSYGFHDGNFFSLYMNFDAYSGEHVGYIGNQAMSFEDLGIGFFPHEDGVSVTAHHHPDGVLLIYGQKNRPSGTQRQRISTLEITPALLEHYRIRPPNYMVTPRAAIRDALAVA
jgi:hypothetical protein